MLQPQKSTFINNNSTKRNHDYGWGVSLMYFLPDGTSAISTPFGNSLGTSSALTVGSTIHFSPA